MRVVICNNMVTPYTNRLFNDLVDRGIELHVLSCTLRETNRKWSGDYAKKYDHVVLTGFEYVLNGPTRVIHFNPGLWRALGHFKPELITINGIYPTMLVAVLWSLVHRIPMALLTDGWRLTMPQSIFHRVVRPFVVGRCRAIICTSEKGRQFFIEEGVDPKRIFVAHLAPAWDAPAELPDFDNRPYHLLWCGRFDDPFKNPSFFVDLAVQLKRCLTDLRIRVIGDGPLLHQFLNDLSRAGVNFDHTAYVPPEEIAKVFVSARMLVMPSIVEAWGLVCNEAMQCGTPCLVSPNTGVANELVVHGQSGFVLNLDVKQWTDAIARTVTNRASWTALSNAAVQSAARYDSRSASKKYLEGFIFAARGSS
jgi:glycosyltransferase involved in cell wall biosynthesis